MRSCLLPSLLACALTGVLADRATAAPNALPDYLDFQLQARSGIGPGFNLPLGASINSATVDLNDAGRVAVRVSLPTGIPGDDFTRHIFVGENGAGYVVSEGPTGSLVSDPRVAPNGIVWFAANFEGGNALAGIYRYDASDQSTVRVTALPAGTTFYEFPRGNALGQIGYRVSFGSSKAWVSYAGGSVQTHAAESGIYSFLFTPSFDENQVIAGKVTLAGSGFNQIRTVDNHAVAVILARSSAETAASPYVNFDNSPAISPTTGRVAFIATLAAGVRGVYRYDSPGNIVEIARTGTQGLGSIESFGPAINDDGLVAFRGVDSNGKQAIFVGDDSTLRRVIGRGDPIDTDLGLGQIDQETPGSPAFSGGVAINASGDIAFSPTLTPFGNNQIEWGTGVYVAHAGTQLIHASGFEGN
ncbi:MAG: hypothetical protein IPO66_12515 [Rhodanobacteraceae bacterium]|nr:hypothetical protein [Rhodanobacteraceae bacterium]